MTDDKAGGPERVTDEGTGTEEGTRRTTQRGRVGGGQVSLDKSAAQAAAPPVTLTVQPAAVAPHSVPADVSAAAAEPVPVGPIPVGPVPVEPARVEPVGAGLAGAASQQGGASPWGQPQRASDPNASGAAALAPDAPPLSDIAQKRLIAGLLGIFLGSLGIHKLYLNITAPGIVMLSVSLVGWVMFTLLFIVLIGFVFLLLPGIMGVIGLIEGILYLSRSDAEFEREYLVNKKPWL